MLLLDALGIRTWEELRRFGRRRGAMRRAKSRARKLDCGGWSDFKIVNAIAQYSEPDWNGLPRNVTPARVEHREPVMTCRNCGGSLLGDGFTVVLHCENAEEADCQYREPDAAPVHCRADSSQGEE